VVMITTQLPGDQQNREVVCIPARKLAGFLATINYRKVRNSLRPKILAYQKECDKALNDYWTKGRAVNPRQEERKLPTTFAESLRMLANEVELTTALKQQLAEAKPQIEFAQAIEDSTRSVKVGDFAKVLCNTGINIGQNRLFAFLRDEGFLMMNNLPFQSQIDCGNFVVIERTRHSDNGPVPYFQTRITGKGQLAIQRKLAVRRAA
jgi:phage antirepressor YoqD-like protein